MIGICCGARRCSVSFFLHLFLLALFFSVLLFSHRLGDGSLVVVVVCFCFVSSIKSCPFISLS